MRRNDTNLFAVLGATAVGTMIGVAVGLLFAPKSGDELRGDLAATGKDLYKRAKEKRDEFFDDLEDEVEEIGDFDLDDEDDK